MVPDLVLICENMLMAEGFTQAKVRAYRVYILLYICVCIGEILVSLCICDNDRNIFNAI